MRATYSVIGNKVFRINTSRRNYLNTLVPIDTPKSNVVLKVDDSNKVIEQTIFITDIPSELKSNKELVEDLKEVLRKTRTVEIKDLNDYYKVYVDYSLFTDGKEIEHANVIRPVSFNDRATLLGVNSDNECCYKSLKDMMTILDFNLKPELPFGIIANLKKEIRFKIHDICIFQSNNEFKESHNSIYDIPFTTNSSMISENLFDSTMIYSSRNSGISFQEVVLPYTPRRISIKISAILSNYIEVYDDFIIDKILKENEALIIKELEEKLKPPVKKYKKVESTTPGALKVVADDIDAGTFDDKTMVKKADVIKDIPDINIGDYVIKE